MAWDFPVFSKRPRLSDRGPLRCLLGVSAVLVVSVGSPAPAALRADERAALIIEVGAGTPEGDAPAASLNDARPFPVPISPEEATLGAGFGPQRHPLLHVMRMHEGVDWAARPGTRVVAVADGAVAQIGYQGAFGNRVVITHASGVETSYSQLNQFAEALKLGDQVKRGQLIGFVGSTGLSAEPHLHFEVRIDGSPIDPLGVVSRESLWPRRPN